MSWHDENQFEEMLGAVVVEIDEGDDQLIFHLEDGRVGKLYHSQDCCESVYIDDICGDLGDLLSSPLLVCEEVTNEKDLGPAGKYDESYTWTFYKMATIKGSVTIRWYGSSNGYYSESVEFKFNKQ